MTHPQSLSPAELVLKQPRMPVLWLRELRHNAVLSLLLVHRPPKAYGLDARRADEIRCHGSSSFPAHS